MLEELYLENVVLFAKGSIPFGPGLNAISGETGAGKSLVAKALALALGGRASTDAIRAGAETARITAAFLLDPKAAAKLTDLHEDGRILFERTLARGKPSRLHINGRPAPAATAQELADRLIDVAAQNEQTRLTDPAYQRELLDRFGKLEKPARAYADRYATAASLRARLEAGDAKRAQVARRLEEVRYLLGELEALGYDPESDPGIEERIRALGNAQEIHTLADSAAATLTEEEDAVQDRIARLQREAEALADCSPALREAARQAETALAAVEAMVAAFQDAADGLDGGPEELDQAIERAEALKRVARRLACDPEGIPAREAELRREEERLATWEIDTDEVKARLRAAAHAAAEAGLALRAARAKAGKKLAKAVDRHLQDLGMPEANFTVRLEPLWDESDAPESLVPRATGGGLEEVVFTLAPNPGEAASTLAETASGGEASRAMLAIKTALSAVHAPPLLFFDEIDAGIGGRLGDAIATKLLELAKDRQIVTITHLPQVAARADRHLKVTKRVTGKRTEAGVEVLAEADRVEEIAQMIRGDQANDTTRAQAREMLGRP